MRRFFVIILLFALFFSLTDQYYSQSRKHYTITGKVLDKGTGKPIPLANVFLDGTTFGAATDNSGKYEIKNVVRGSYKIVVSMIGYEQKDVNIQLMDSATIVVNFKIATLSYKLEEINITTERDYDWIDDYEFFKKNFLGTSNNSEECSIMNKGVLEFIKSDEFKLKAKASEPLKILNKALGYIVYFDMKDFEILNDDEINYYGTIHFEELIPNNKDEKLKWEKKREEAYKGSLRHFLTSLCKGKLQENGFYCYKVNFPKWEDLRNRKYLDPYLSEIIERISPVERVLQFNKYIMVTYMEEWEERDFLAYRNYHGSKIFQRLDFQTSWVKLPYGFAMFDLNGNVVDNYKSVKVYGYWAWQKIADLMPTDYVPRELN